ncbi:MAG: hypothetical protein R2873_25995 [Caldilineaceae bacterium]
MRPSERLAPTPVDEISVAGTGHRRGQNLLNRNPNSTLATAAGASILLAPALYPLRPTPLPAPDTPLTFSDDE